jgi:hypothetical protein
MAPPSAADGLDGARRPAIVGHQGFDGEERLKQPQILCHLFPCRQKSADFDRRSHRVRRESHARFCERLAVKFHRPTHPPHLGQVVGRQECGATSDGEEPLRPLAAVTDWCRRNRHQPIPDQHAHLIAMARGHYAYYGITGNFRRLRWCAEG